MTVTIAARWQLVMWVRPVPQAVRGVTRAGWQAWFSGIGIEELAARQATQRLLADERWQWERNLLFLQRRNGA